MRSHLAVVLIAISFSAAPVFSYTDSSLVRAFNQMNAPAIESATAVPVSGLIIESHDLRLCLDSGTVYFLAPITLDSSRLFYGGYFQGRGRFQFHPSLHMERNQLARYFDSDSLNRNFSRGLLYFDQQIFDQITSTAGSRSAGPAPSGILDGVTELQDMLTKNEQKSFLFSILNNLAFPHKPGFLMVRTELSGGDDLVYSFDPYESEEVSLTKQSFCLGVGNYLETICSYSVYADDTYESVDGLNKDALKIEHCGFDGVMNRSGDLIGIAQVTCRTEIARTQMAAFALSDDLVMDSVRDSASHPVSFLKFKKKSHQDGSVYVILPRPLQSGESVSLIFYYHGNIAHTELGEFYVQADCFWYPRLGFRQRSTFDLKFRTPVDYAFVATGKELERRKGKDTLYTHFEVTNPSVNVSFDIGTMKKYSFADTTATPVDVYYSEDLHRTLAKSLADSMIGVGSHMEKQVGDDVVGALKLFSRFFGLPPESRTIATEILSSQSDAYPGLVRLGSSTWINTDAWGNDRMLRAHEVAHQWWGVSVGYRSYRDQWLSEGFSEYCSLMYLQGVAGNGKFNDRIDAYRKELTGAKGTRVGDALEAPPVALGYRGSRVGESDVGSLNLYQKGAYILHMLRNLMLDLRTMREDRFLTMMKDYRAICKDSNATTQDFRRVVEKHVGENMRWFFDEWVYHSYIPTYDFKYETVGVDSSGCKIMLHISQKDVPTGFKMYVPLEIQFGDGKAYLRILVDSPQIDLPVELPKIPKRLVLNPFNSVLARVNQ